MTRHFKRLDNKIFKKMKYKQKVDGPKPFHTTLEFRALQTEWYDKLKEGGFNDLEWTDPKSENPQDSPFLKGSNFSYIKVRFRDQNPYQLYRILGLFANSQEFFNLFAPEWHQFNQYILTLYSEGKSYRQIERLAQQDASSFNKKYSLSSKSPIFRRMTILIQAAKDWYNASEMDE